MSHQPDNIAEGTQIVFLVEVRRPNGSLVHPRGAVPVRVEEHRERLLSVKRGELPWAEVDAWRKELHQDFENALAKTKLPERPDHEAANRFLIKARREITGREISKPL